MCFKVGNPQKYNALLLILVILLWVISTCQASKGIVLYLKNELHNVCLYRLTSDSITSHYPFKPSRNSTWQKLWVSCKMPSNLSYLKSRQMTVKHIPLLQRHYLKTKEEHNFQPQSQSCYFNSQPLSNSKLTIVM